jgi:hypothetical protein
MHIVREEKEIIRLSLTIRHQYHKADATSLQDLRTPERPAQDSPMGKNSETETRELAQDAQQKIPPPAPAFPAGWLFVQTHRA